MREDRSTENIEILADHVRTMHEARQGQIDLRQRPQTTNASAEEWANLWPVLALVLLIGLILAGRVLSMHLL